MRKRLIVVVGLFVLVACGSSDRTSDDFGVPYPDLVLNSLEEKISYAIGADIGANFNNMPDEMFELFYADLLEEAFYQGLTKVEKETKDCQRLLEAAFSSPTGIDTSLYDMRQLSDCYGYIFGEMMRKNLDGKDAFSYVLPEFSRKGFAHALFEVDTLIPLEERRKMVVDFNNDMSKAFSERLMSKAMNESNAIVGDKGWVLLEQKAGSSQAIDTEKEFKIVYTLMNAAGDTIISTLLDKNLPDEENSQVINTDDIVIPTGWMLAAEQMKVGGEYKLYLPYELAYGDRGLMNQRSTGYIIQPYTAVIINSKVLEQAEIHSFIKTRGAKIIAEAKKRPNTKVGASGYVLETLQAGEGAKVPAGSDVKAHYILSNSSGDVVENSYMGAQQGRGVPAFSLNGVIKGWQEAVPEMQKGGRYKLYLPYDIAYGEQGSGNIPPFETLTFEMEIVDFGKPGSLTQQRQ